MARAGDELVHRFTGQQLIFRKTAAETGGALLEIESVMPRGGEWPPEHYHPQQDERFEVLSGTVTVRSGDGERTYAAGETIEIPRGMPHTMRNAGAGVARLRWETRPALATATFFETIYGLARDGKTNQKGIPNLLQLAVIAREYRREFVPARPPLPVQRVVFGLLAAVGRLLGYRGRYARYSDVGTAPTAR